LQEKKTDPARKHCDPISARVMVFDGIMDQLLDSRCNLPGVTPPVLHDSAAVAIRRVRRSLQRLRPRFDSPPASDVRVFDIYIEACSHLMSEIQRYNFLRCKRQDVRQTPHLAYSSGKGGRSPTGDI
jgi:hypothetical protein